MNWMSILGLCLIVLGTVFSFFGTYSSDKEGQAELTNKIQEKNQVIDQINLNNIKLVEQNTSLIQSNTEVSHNNKDLLNQNKSLIESNVSVSNNNKELLNQNAEMLKRVAKYQNEIEDRNRKIEILEKQIQDVKNFYSYADLDITGRNIQGTPNQIIITSGISILMDKILVKTNDIYNLKNDIVTLTIINEVIAKYPNFPFGYWARAIYLRDRGDKTWKLSAEQAIKILEITTTVTGHHGNHDQALAQLKEILEKK
jgi:hypothetical protein